MHIKNIKFFLILSILVCLFINRDIVFANDERTPQKISFKDTERVIDSKITKDDKHIIFLVADVKSKNRSKTVYGDYEFKIYILTRNSLNKEKVISLGKYNYNDVTLSNYGNYVAINNSRNPKNSNWDDYNIEIYSLPSYKLIERFNLCNIKKDNEGNEISWSYSASDRYMEFTQNDQYFLYVEENDKANNNSYYKKFYNLKTKKLEVKKLISYEDYYVSYIDNFVKADDYTPDGKFYIKDTEKGITIENIKNKKNIRVFKNYHSDYGASPVLFNDSVGISVIPISLNKNNKMYYGNLVYNYKKNKYINTLWTPINKSGRYPALSGLIISNDGKNLLATYRDKKVRLFNVKTGKIINTTSFSNYIFPISNYRNKAILSVNGKDFILYDLKTRKKLKTIRSSKNNIILNISNSNKYFLTSSYTKYYEYARYQPTVYIWDVSDFL